MTYVQQDTSRSVMNSALLGVSNTPRNDEDNVIIEGSHGGPYMVEKIVGIFMGKDKKKYYRVKWIDSWEPEENLSEACQTLIDEFWNGTTLDQTGAVVKKGDLKQGLKVIKKEVPSSSENLTTTPQTQQQISTPEKSEKQTNNVSSNKASEPVSNKAQNSESVSTEKATIVKRDPSVNEELTTAIAKKSAISASSVATSQEHQNFNQSRQNDDLSSKDPSPSFKKQLRFSEAMPASSCAETSIPSSSSILQIAHKGLHTLTKSVAHQQELQQRENGEENVLQVCTDQGRVMPSSTPTTLFDDDDELTCVGSPASSVALNFDCLASDGSAYEVDETDYASPMENIIDVESEDDDIEITVAIESPVSRKRQPTTRRTGNFSTPTKRRRGRPPSQPLHRSSRENLPAAMPLHPRCQLRQTTPKKVVGTLGSPAVTSPSRRFYASQGPTVQPPSQPVSHSTGDVSPQRYISNNRHPSFVPTSTQTNAATAANKSPQFSRQCDICKLTFPNVTLARQHSKVKHSSSPSSHTASHTNHETNLLSCSICNGLFRTHRDLKSHMLLHGEHSLYKCEVCSKVFKQRSSLSQHMLIHSEELPFGCDICHKRFRQQAHLILHMGKHGKNNEGVYTCPHCLRDFQDKALFSLHMKEHDADLPFCCNLCKERFKLKSDLLMHLDGHNEGRPFTCHICKKSFKTKTYLYGHMQMHKVRGGNNLQNNENNTTSSTVSIENADDDEEENFCIKKQPFH